VQKEENGKPEHVIDSVMTQLEKRGKGIVRQERQAVDQRVIWQRLQGRLPSCGVVESVGAWVSEDRSDTRRRGWRNGCRTQRHLRLEGHGDGSLYTEAADRKRLVLDAMAKVQGRNEAATSMPSPSSKMRALGLKVE
jgi:hypothetical protein